MPASSSPFTSEPSTLVVTCSPGVAPVLAQELSSLSFRVGAIRETAVETEGTLADCVRLNMRLRTAHRVLYALDVFRARRADDLYDELVAVPWERYLDPYGYFSVDRAVDTPSIRNPNLPSLKVKDAIADRMRGATGRRPDSGNERTDACIFLHWAGDRASVYLDTTGQSLSFRGYREVSSEAPLRESLAAALLLSADWNGRGNFLNPMCGGGTLAIEAAWIAQNRAPALLRENFSFMHFACFEPSVWTDERAAAQRDWERGRKEAADASGGAPAIFASDIDEAAVRATRANAAAAGCEDALELDVCDLLASRIPESAERGLAMLNPPYGGRIGDPIRLRDLYEEAGAFVALAADANHDGYIFTGNPDLAEGAGLLCDRVRTFYSGALECKLLENPVLSAPARRRFLRRNPDIKLPPCQS